MTTDTTQRGVARRSSRLADVRSRQATTGKQPAGSAGPRSKKQQGRIRRRLKENVNLPPKLVVPNQERSMGDQGKGEPADGAVPGPPLDANEADLLNALTGTGVAASREWSKKLKEKWEQAFTNPSRGATQHEARRNELVEEVNYHFNVIRNRLARSFREGERIKNKYELLDREIGKLKAQVQQKAEEIDILIRKVEALPPKFRLKVDPYGEPFRQCRKNRDPSRDLPESLTSEFSKLREDALKCAAPASLESDLSEDGSSDKTLTECESGRKRQRDDELYETSEPSEPKPSSGDMACEADAFRRTVYEPTSRPAKRMRRKK